eukprot:jgi/Undpi1/9377/HiC_scaffold_26.g11835.m1
MLSGVKTLVTSSVGGVPRIAVQHGSWPSGVDGVTRTAVSRRGFGEGSGEADEKVESAGDAPGAGPGAGVGAGVGARPGVADERVLGIVSVLLTFSAPRWYLIEDFGDYNTSELAS